MEIKQKKSKAVVIGAGLVGTLQACVLAQEGYDVDLYEYRSDIRKMEQVSGNSINLAISIRGLSGLKMVGLDSHILNEYGIPMYARMIHNMDDSTYEIPYGKKNQCIYSVGRRYINEILLNRGEKYSNLRYHFNHKLINVDFSETQLQFKNENNIVNVKPNIVFGCDGAYSAVRSSIMKHSTMNYQQKYIPHSYIEFLMPSKLDGNYAMKPHYLHIWPRGQFMLIALPNQDKSFTMTLFMPTITFENINDSRKLLDFFNQYFHDALCLTGESAIIKQYFDMKPGSLISIKCSPYHYKDRFVLLGDAAHAMVPFYGQGMNCGMEDVVVLHSIMKKNANNVLAAFQEYSEFRNPDAEAMCDLALYNYIEMRDLVNKPSFLLRKHLDNWMNRIMPSRWIPLYTAVTFSRLRYHKCIETKKWQDQILMRMVHMAKLTCLSFLGIILYQNNHIIVLFLTKLKLKLNFFV